MARCAMLGAGAGLAPPVVELEWPRTLLADLTGKGGLGETRWHDQGWQVLGDRFRLRRFSTGEVAGAAPPVSSEAGSSEDSCSKPVSLDGGSARSISTFSATFSTRGPECAWRAPGGPEQAAEEAWRRLGSVGSDESARPDLGDIGDGGSPWHAGSPARHNHTCLAAHKPRARARRAGAESLAAACGCWTRASSSGSVGSSRSSDDSQREAPRSKADLYFEAEMARFAHRSEAPQADPHHHQQAARRPAERSPTTAAAQSRLIRRSSSAGSRTMCPPASDLTAVPERREKQLNSLQPLAVAPCSPAQHQRSPAMQRTSSSARHMALLYTDAAHIVLDHMDSTKCLDLLGKDKARAAPAPGAASAGAAS